jgi:hypothetical protein
VGQGLVPVSQPLTTADAGANPAAMVFPADAAAPPTPQPVAQPLVQQELTPPPAPPSDPPTPSRPSGRNPDRGPDRGPDRNPDRAPLLVHHPGHVRAPAPPAGPPLTVSEIMGILRPQMPRMVRCARDGGYHGNIVGSLNVDARGAVRSVRLDAPFSNSAGASCVAQVLRGTRFPPGRPSDNVRIFASVQ